MPTGCPALQTLDRCRGFVGRISLPPEVAFVIATPEIGGAIAIFAGIIRGSLPRYT